MKRAEIRATVEKHLLTLGFNPQSFLWQPNAQLVLVVGDAVKQLTLKSGISKRNLFFALGKIAGWADAYGISNRPKTNGSAVATGSHAEPAAQPWSFGLGMPAALPA